MQRDIHQHLVEGSIEEGRIDRDHGVQPSHRHSGGRRCGVLLGDANVEYAVGPAGCEAVESDRLEHGSGDAHNVRTTLSDRNDLVGED